MSQICRSLAPLILASVAHLAMPGMSRCANADDESEQVVAEFLNRGKPAWRRMASHKSRAHSGASIRSRTVVVQGGKVLQQVDGAMQIKNGWVYSSGVNPGDGQRNVFARNSRYEFRVSRMEGPDTAANSRWTLEGINDLKSGRIDNNTIAMVNDATLRSGFSNPFYMGDRVITHDLWTAMNLPGFTLTSGRKGTYENKTSYTLRWTFEDPNNSSDELRFPQSGEFEVVPEMNWALVGFSWQWEFKPPKYMTMNATFSDWVEFNGQWVSRKLELRSQRPQQEEVITTQTAEFSAGFERSLHYLSHYGFPEPRLKSNSEWTRLIWISSILGIALGYLSWRWAVKRRSSS